MGLLNLLLSHLSLLGEGTLEGFSMCPEDHLTVQGQCAVSLSLCIMSGLSVSFPALPQISCF